MNAVVGYLSERRPPLQRNSKLKLVSSQKMQFNHGWTQMDPARRDRNRSLHSIGLSKGPGR